MKTGSKILSVDGIAKMWYCSGRRCSEVGVFIDRGCCTRRGPTSNKVLLCVALFCISRCSVVDKCIVKATKPFQ